MIVDLKHQVRNLREDLNMAKMDADRKSVAILTKVFNFCVFICADIEYKETSMFWTFTEKCRKSITRFTNNIEK